MDVPAAAAGPWIVLGAVLGILLLLAAGAVVLRLRSRTPAPPPAALHPAGDRRDDLADFLAHPPGTPGAPDGDGDGDGWAPLALPAPSEEAAPTPTAPGTSPGTALAAIAVVALLLVGVVAALAASARSAAPAPAVGSAPPTGSTPTTGTSPTDPGPGGIAARLAFEGVVLEEHAVGITAAHPELELTVEGDRGVAHLRLPTANCLATSAPPAPGDPACRPARTEYADLSSPDLAVVRDGDEITLSGRFATYRRPPGGAQEWTGRSYDVSVTVAVPDGGEHGWVPAEADLRWDGRVTETRTDDPESVVRSGG